MTLLDILEQESRVQAYLNKLPKELREISETLTFQKDETILNKGESISHIYLLLQGQIKVLNAMPDGNAYSWLIMDPCTFICNLELLTDSPINYSRIDATRETVLLAMERERFTWWIHRDIELLWLVSTDCAKKAYQVSYDMGHGAYKSGLEKVVGYLIKLCGHTPAQTETWVLKKTRPEMASEIGLSVKTINRSLMKLQEEGHIALSGGKVSINRMQMEALRRIWMQISP